MKTRKEQIPKANKAGTFTSYDSIVYSLFSLIMYVITQFYSILGSLSIVDERNPNN